MKKLINACLIILSLIFILFYTKFYVEANSQNDFNQQLYVYNWGEYIDPEVITDFEEEYKIDVIYETYDSNETLYAKLKNNNTRYDVVFPSEYMVDKMNQEQMLLPIDYNKLSNYQYIDPRFLHVSEGNVSIPYFWGTVGIIYNPNLTDLDFDSWNDLWDESLEKQIIIPDSAREVIGMSLQSLGLSVNSTNRNELTWAQDKLFTLQPNIKAIIGDEILQAMPNNEAAVAITWSGSAKYMQEINPDLIYTIPEEGTNIWVDSAVIPTTCQNIEGAHQFINYLMDSNVSQRNSEYVGYTPTNIITQEIMKKDEENIAVYYPDEVKTQKYEFYKNLSSEDNMLYNDLFLEFKMF